MNNVIINITAEDVRRVDFLFRTALNTDINQVKSIITGVIERHELIISLENRPTLIRMSNINRDCLEFTVRVWTKTPDYWMVFFDLNEQVKEEFDKNRIVIPLPQVEIHECRG
jgi:small conductance mechanosensitive channel